MGEQKIDNTIYKFTLGDITQEAEEILKKELENSVIDVKEIIDKMHAGTDVIYEGDAFHVYLLMEALQHFPLLRGA